MAKYRIAILPGDGVGKDVVEAAMTVPEKLESTPNTSTATSAGNSGARKATPFPTGRSNFSRKPTPAFSAPSPPNPRKTRRTNSIRRCRGKGLSYFSPIVRLRQEFDLYTNLRPCKAYPGNPLNYKDDIDLVIFRENTEGMYAGVEFRPLPAVGQRRPARSIPR